MHMNSLKLIRRVLFGGLAVVLCLVLLENAVSRYRTRFSERKFHFSTGHVTVNEPAHTAPIEETLETEASAVMLWWTPFIGEMEYTKNCGNAVCFFSGNDKYLRHPKLKVSKPLKVVVTVQFTVICRHSCSMAAIWMPRICHYRDRHSICGRSSTRNRRKMFRICCTIRR